MRQIIVATGVMLGVLAGLVTVAGCSDAEDPAAAPTATVLTPPAVPKQPLATGPAVGPGSLQAQLACGAYARSTTPPPREKGMSKAAYAKATRDAAVGSVRSAAEQAGSAAGLDPRWKALAESMDALAKRLRKSSAEEIVASSMRGDEKAGALRTKVQRQCAAATPATPKPN